MNTNIGLCSVFVNILRIVLTVSISEKGRFVIEEDKRITALSYKKAIADSKVECSMICQHSERCTGANYRVDTRTCYQFNQTCFGTENADGWKYLHQPQAERTFIHISNQNLSWDNAKTYCESIGGGLANILTTADHDILLSILNQYGDPEQIWLGASDREIEGEWIWSNGCRFDNQDFKFWKPGQPANRGGNEHCFGLKNLGWNDENCADLLTFVCEINV